LWPVSNYLGLSCIKDIQSQKFGEEYIVNIQTRLQLIGTALVDKDLTLESYCYHLAVAGSMLD